MKLSSETVISAKGGDGASLNYVLLTMERICQQIVQPMISHRPDVQIDDAMQEARLSLLDAVKYWNPDKGFQFSTYAGDCVRNRISRWLGLGANRDMGQETEEEHCGMEDQPVLATVGDGVVRYVGVRSKLSFSDLASVVGMTPQELLAVCKSKLQSDRGVLPCDLEE